MGQCPLLHPFIWHTRAVSPFPPDHAGCSSADSGSTSTAAEAAELLQNSRLLRRGAGLVGG